MAAGGRGFQGHAFFPERAAARSQPVLRLPGLQRTAYPAAVIRQPAAIMPAGGCNERQTSRPVHRPGGFLRSRLPAGGFRSVFEKK
jgi:hypothetical protein